MRGGPEYAARIKCAGRGGPARIATPNYYSIFSFLLRSDSIFSNVMTVVIFIKLVMVGILKQRLNINNWLNMFFVRLNMYFLYFSVNLKISPF